LREAWFLTTKDTKEEGKKVKYIIENKTFFFVSFVSFVSFVFFVVKSYSEPARSWKVA
jgi:hypothetical protein